MAYFGVLLPLRAREARFQKCQVVLTNLASWRQLAPRTPPGESTGEFCLPRRPPPPVIRANESTDSLWPL